MKEMPLWKIIAILTLCLGLWAAFLTLMYFQEKTRIETPENSPETPWLQ